VRKQGPMSPRDAAVIGVDIAKAIGAVHAAGLLHCDIKAQNVVRETTGRVVLMDFGAGRLAPEAHDGDQLSDVAGTPRYMAPELFHSYSKATRGTDLYSFGVLLYYMVSGKFPVDGKTLGELRQAHTAGQMRPLPSVRPDVPPALAAIVARAIDPDPERRPATADEVQAVLAPITTEPEPDRRVTRLEWWWLAIGASVAALAIALLSPLFRPATTLPAGQSIAVLPIKNLTGDPSKQYLADGLTEVLVAHLARLPGLEVASSATTATLRGSTDDEKAIAEKLGVRLLLAGSVLQADDRVALSVQLTDPRSGRTIWGSTLERLPSTILSTRSEIASLVAARLALSAPAVDSVTRQQPVAEAQDVYLRGLVEASSGSVNSRMLEAERLFARATELAPEWAEPLAHLALTQQYTTEFGNPERRAERAEIVRSNALRAIQLDPALPASYLALAAVQAYHDWDLPSAEATLRQAIAAAPQDGTARGRLAFVLAARGRLPEAIAEAQTARDREPMVPERHGVLGMVRYYARDWPAALKDMERALVLNPQFAVAHLGKGLVLGASGVPDEAVASIQRALSIAENPGWLAALGVTCARAAMTTCVSGALQRLRELERQGAFVSIDQYAYIAGYRREFDEAFRLLDEAVDRRMTNVLWLAVDPRADPLRGDPRFDRLVARMGFVSR
jgi:TolB-like protein/Tfp pilus assembly protein PilF